MSTPSDTGRQRRAAYSFRGTDTELDKSAPLMAGETVLIHGGLRARENGVINAPAVVRFTNLRLIVIRHFAFHSDRLWEVPARAVESVDETGRAVVVHYRDRDEGTAVIRLTPWTGRNPPARPLRDLSGLAQALRT